MADQVRMLFLMATMIDAIKFLKNKSFSVFTLFPFCSVISTHLYCITFT